MAEIYVDKQVHALRVLHHDNLQADRSAIAIRDFLSQQASTLFEAHAQGNEAVVFHLACWCPPLISQKAPHIMQYPVSIDEIRHSVAREHGFEQWAEVEALGDTLFDHDFESAVELALSGKVSALSSLLDAKPQLVNQRSSFAHAATILHYMAANGVESHRQITPLNAAEVLRTLISAGVEVNAAANIYGGGSRVLGLMMSSAHPRNAGILDELENVLVDAGAR